MRTEIYPEKFNLLPKGKGYQKNTDTRNNTHKYELKILTYLIINPDGSSGLRFMGLQVSVSFIFLT